jgi:hypothetical protein
MKAKGTRLLHPPYRAAFVTVSILAACLILISPASAQLNQSVYANVTGQVPGTQIGTLNSSATLSGGQVVEEATFQLNNSFNYLMNDAQNWQFRYFQIVTVDTDPINYLGQPLNAPYADPPSNGWDYQRNPANNWQTGTPGADTSPFYENDNGFALNPNSYPTYSGSLNVFGGANGNFPIHSQAGGYVRTQDVPGIPANNSLSFDTFITFYAPGITGNQFIPLAGYSWGITANGTGALTPTAPTALDLSQDALQADVINAMAADGFTGWNALFGGTITVPEPGVLALLAMAFTALVLRVQRRYQPA